MTLCITCIHYDKVTPLDFMRSVNVSNIELRKSIKSSTRCLADVNSSMARWVMLVRANVESGEYLSSLA